MRRANEFQFSVSFDHTAAACNPFITIRHPLLSNSWSRVRLTMHRRLTHLPKSYYYRQMYRTTSSQHYVSSAMISKTTRICGDRILHKILSFAHDISSSKGTAKFPKRIVKLKDEMRDDFEHAHYFFIAFSFLEEFFRLDPLINV